jgi:hypothetical protein
MPRRGADADPRRTVVLPARTEVKMATEDGQDLLTPLVEHAAEAVSAATTKP